MGYFVKFVFGLLAPPQSDEHDLDRLLDRAEVIIIRGARYRAQGRIRLTEEVPTSQKQS